VLTDRDIVVTVVGRDAEPKSLKVMDIMTHNPLSCRGRAVRCGRPAANERRWHPTPSGGGNTQ
jgi:hypothetical protein